MKVLLLLWWLMIKSYLPMHQGLLLWVMEWYPTQNRNTAKQVLWVPVYLARNCGHASYAKFSPLNTGIYILIHSQIQMWFCGVTGTANLIHNCLRMTVSPGSTQHWQMPTSQNLIVPMLHKGCCIQKSISSPHHQWVPICPMYRAGSTAQIGMV